MEEKVWLQMETLCDDQSTADSLELHLALPHTCCLLAHTAHTRLIHHCEFDRLYVLISHLQVKSLNLKEFCLNAAFESVLKLEYMQVYLVQ